ncbi:DNA helicase II [Pantoea sp. Aalb]|uniref:DNA helicase II n=1 Tax=Pantoea sp. Aalb TaxID=2576762 RepID=UPI001329A740|nr:DNA helicase II [Pantoea sp. Aalb]MXP67650.1 DNA helicase II [Pantoea sp. Aalb]
MQVNELIKNLNNKQREAVMAPRRNILVLAGAGSGKTRVLAYRIAWLLSVEHCSPYSIMAVTFTNKAAEEMRKRINCLIGNNKIGMWIGNFHGLAHHLLRIHHLDAGLPNDFQILDEEDQLRLLKRLIKDMNLDERKWPAHQLMWYINGKKDKGLRPNHITNYRNLAEKTWVYIYEIYQETCNRAGLVDFSELLLRTHELWLNKPKILNQYRKRFSNILVDEFQDTNNIQYAWIKILAGDTGRVIIVGDDDQSIYGWRGAQVANIQHFLNDFPNTKTIRLEQNYRSTNNILRAANALIENNNDRLGKKLWTDGSDGDLISLYCALNELDEARFVINCIKKWHEHGNILNNCAILYRSNVQSRVLEEALLQLRIPYHIYGGVRFFERQEVKNVLAYLRLIVNRNDDAAFERVINIPARGIGNRTVERIREIAGNHRITLWQATQDLLYSKTLFGRIAYSLKCFCELIDCLEKEIINLPLPVQTERVIHDSKLWCMYEQDKSEKGQIRIKNLEELITATRQFNYYDECNFFMPLKKFLSHVVLESTGEQENKCQDAVQLMTIHAAKGLEFSKVFIVGMEEGIFPSQMSLDKEECLEEERRLAYVGMTRAIKNLTLTYAKTRRLYGKEFSHRPSRFINELPIEYIEEVNLRTKSIYKNQIQSINKDFVLGQRINHVKFGEGIIINFAGSGKHSQIQVAFQNHGIKWLVIAYARLKGL